MRRLSRSSVSGSAAVPPSGSFQYCRVLNLFTYLTVKLLKVEFLYNVTNKILS